MELRLEDTMQATLAKLGRSTRYNLGYYRRRLARELPCEFIADARGLLQEHEIQAINEGSLNPVPLQDFRLQYESSCKLPGGFLLGLRTPAGKWMSLVGGWRQAGVTVHYWQMNTAGYEKLSIGKAMLSYFLEHEVSLRTRSLIYNGGTPNPIRFSFLPTRGDLPDRAASIVAERRSAGCDADSSVAAIICSHQQPPGANDVQRRLQLALAERGPTGAASAKATS